MSYGHSIPPPGKCLEYETRYTSKLVGYDLVSSAVSYPPSNVVVKYRIADSATAKQDVIQSTSIVFDLTEGFQEQIVPGSVRFKLGNRTYIDRDGLLYFDLDVTNNSATYGGTIDYSVGTCVITNWQTGANNVLSVESLLTTIDSTQVSDIQFRVPSAPVTSGSLQIRVNKLEGGAQLTAVSNADGTVTGTEINGYIDYQTGMVNLAFGKGVVAAGNESEPWYFVENLDDSGNVWKETHVLADTLLYNATSQSFLPLDQSILGLNPVRLPVDGRIPIYSKGDVVVILNDQITGGTYINDQVVDLGRGRIAKLSIRDSVGQLILASKYTADLDVGTVTFLDVSGLSQPLSITDRIEDMALLTDVQITGKLALSQPLTHDFPLADTLVSNAVIFGDKFAHTSIPFDQKTWTGVWSDILIGDETSAQYNNTQFPITVDNASALQERWHFIFTNSTTGNIVGEHVGQILTGVTIGSDIAPINPNTTQPFFTIPNGGWGSGWSAGNILRFNTYGANASTWIIQSVGQGDATDTDFDFNTETRGDINTVV